MHAHFFHIYLHIIYIYICPYVNVSMCFEEVVGVCREVEYTPPKMGLKGGCMQFLKGLCATSLRGIGRHASNPQKWVVDYPPKRELHTATSKRGLPDGI